MRAFILAAGTGSRLGLGIPKALLVIDGQTLLERQVGWFRKRGLDVTVVVGYKAANVMAAIGAAASFVFNERYRKTGSLYSLQLGSTLFPSDEGALVSYADVFMEESIVQAVLEREDGVVVTKGYDGRGTRLYLEGEKIVSVSEATQPDPGGVSFAGVARLSAKTLARIPEVRDFEKTSATFSFIGCSAVYADGYAVNVNRMNDLEYILAKKGGDP